MSAKKLVVADLTGQEDFENLVNLLSVYSAANNDMKELQSELNDEMLTATDERRERYAKLQTAPQNAEDALRVIVGKHPGWFTEKKSLKTPYGEVSFHMSTSLEPEKKEISLLLIKSEISVLLVRLEKETNMEQATLFRDRLKLLESCIRRKEELNLEALEKLSDVELGVFKITRQKNDNFSIKPAEIEMGKAIAAADKKKEKTAK